MVTGIDIGVYLDDVDYSAAEALCFSLELPVRLVYLTFGLSWTPLSVFQLVLDQIGTRTALF